MRLLQKQAKASNKEITALKQQLTREELDPWTKESLELSARIDALLEDFGADLTTSVSNTLLFTW